MCVHSLATSVQSQTKIQHQNLSVGRHGGTVPEVRCTSVKRETGLESLVCSRAAEANKEYRPIEARFGLDIPGAS